MYRQQKYNHEETPRETIRINYMTTEALICG